MGCFTIEMKFFSNQQMQSKFLLLIQQEEEEEKTPIPFDQRVEQLPPTSSRNALSSNAS